MHFVSLSHIAVKLYNWFLRLHQLLCSHLLFILKYKLFKLDITVKNLHNQASRIFFLICKILIWLIVFTAFLSLMNKINCKGPSYVSLNCFHLVFSYFFRAFSPTSDVYNFALTWFGYVINLTLGYLFSLLATSSILLLLVAGYMPECSHGLIRSH